MKDPLILIFPGKRWSYAVAEQEYVIEHEDNMTGQQKDDVEINVHHHGFDGRQLVPSWVKAPELKAYLADVENSTPPKERLAQRQPENCVAYIVPFRVADILLAGPATAELEQGFLTELQPPVLDIINLGL